MNSLKTVFYGKAVHKWQGVKVTDKKIAKLGYSNSTTYESHCLH